MNMKKIIAVSSVAIALAFGGQSAHAAISYDFTGNSVNVGTLSVGETGTIGDVANLGGSIFSSVSGILPSNSAVTFTYNLNDNLNFGSLNTSGSYSYNAGGDVFSGFSTDSNFGANNAAGFVNGASSTALAVATAQIDFSNNTATAIIQNNSAGSVNFLNLFVGLVQGAGNLEIAYSVSAVPLPAALPLFASALAGLFGFSYRRKKMAVAAA